MTQCSLPFIFVPVTDKALLGIKWFASSLFVQYILLPEEGISLCVCTQALRLRAKMSLWVDDTLLLIYLF